MPDAPDAPVLSVVMVTHDSARVVGPCLAALARELDGLPHELFVVDSASSDGTPDLVRSLAPHARVTESRDNIGFSGGNNMALPQCRGRYLLLLNPDTEVHPESLRALMTHLDAHPEAGAAGPRLLLPDGTVQPECARRLPTASNMLPWLLLLDKLEWRLRFRGRTRAFRENPPRGTWCDRFALLAWDRSVTCPVEFLCGASLMLRADVLRRIGLLDEAAPLYLDDIDYCRRIRDAGWELHYVAESSVTHLWQKSSGSRPAEPGFYAMVCHSIWLFLGKHDGKGAAWAFAASAAAAGSIRVAVCLAALALPGAERRRVVRRQLAMAASLARWGFRSPKAPPRLGFAERVKVSGR